MRWLNNMVDNVVKSARAGVEAVEGRFLSTLNSVPLAMLNKVQAEVCRAGIPFLPPCEPRRQGQVTLRQLEEPEVSTVLQWLQDDLDLARSSFGQRQDTPDCAVRKMLKEYNNTMQRTLHHYLGVEVAGHLEGMVFFEVRQNYAYNEKQGYLGILLGKAKARGRGLGTTAMHLALEYIFGEVNCDCVELDTADYNVAAQRCYARLGFSPCHHQRFYEDLPPLDNEYLAPALYYRLTREEWVRRGN